MLRLEPLKLPQFCMVLESLVDQECPPCCSFMSYRCGIFPQNNLSSSFSQNLKNSALLDHISNTYVWKEKFKCQVFEHIEGGRKKIFI